MMSSGDQASFLVNQTMSIRDRIIFDEESTETLIYMVNCAKNVLKANYNYFTVRQMMLELINVMDEEEMMPPFLCGMDEDKVDRNEREAMVDKYIDELLRFLAMRVLLATPPTEESEHDDREEMTSKLYQLNASVAIRESWKALLMLPHTYSDVCKALGVPSPLDYDEEESEFQGEASTSQWGRECYRWTLQTYASLYVVGPPKTFWPELEAHRQNENVSLMTTFMTKIATALQNMDRKNTEMRRKAKMNATRI